MKLTHCPRCRDLVVLLLPDYPHVTLKHLRRAHVDHSVPRHGRRALIRKGRKP